MGEFYIYCFYEEIQRILERLDEKDFIEVKGGFVDLDIG